MRRVLAVMGLVLLIGGGFALWWYLRDTPAKVLHDGFAQIVQARSAKKFTLDVAITDPASRATTGFTLISEVDVSDLTHPRSLGELRIGARTSTEQDQTVDLILDKDRAALRPRNVSANYRLMYQQLLGDASTTIPFLTVDRDAFLKGNGFAEAVASGKPVDVRAALPYLLPILVPGDRLTYSADKSLVSAGFHFDRRTVKPFLIVLVNAWVGDSPTVDEYAWIDRATEDLGRGNFTLTIDSKMRTPIRLVGDFPLTDEGQNVRKNVHASVDVSGLNEPVAIGIPKETKDVTGRFSSAQNLSTLPSSGERVFTGGASSSFSGATGTGSFQPGSGSYTNVGNVVPETDIDLFQKYSDELHKSKAQ